MGTRSQKDNSVVIDKAMLLWGLIMLLAPALASTTLEGWTLVWADEFDGSSLNDSKWDAITGNGCEEVICGWGNNEKQTYTREALTLEGGDLVITAAKAVPGSGMNYTSGRIHTMGKAEFLYGRVEARMRLPLGNGLWPAFWMLPSDLRYGAWAASGEVDIVESCNLMETIESTLHFGDQMPDNTDSNLYPKAAMYACPGGGFCQYKHPSGGSFSDNFHKFAVEWEPQEFRWSVDDNVYCRKKHWYSVAAPFPAPYDVKFHLILNVAMGGAYSVVPIDETALPQQLRVDYIRVYQRSEDPTVQNGISESGSLFSESCPYDPPGKAPLLGLRLLLLTLVNGGAAMYLALTGFDGLALFKIGWNACDMAMSVGCGASGGGAFAMAFREATVDAVSIALFLYVAQCVILRRHLSLDLMLQFGVPLLIGMYLGGLAVFAYKAPLRPFAGLIASFAAILLLARRLGLGKFLPMGCGAPCMPAGRLQAQRELVERIKPATWCGGGIVGFLQGYAGLGGPLMIGFVVATDMERDRWRACGPFFLILLDSARTVYVVDAAAYGSLWSKPTLMAVVALSAVVGTLWGHHAAERTPQEGFQLLTALSLLGCGIIMLSMQANDLDAAWPVTSFWALVIVGVWGLRHFIVSLPAIHPTLPKRVSRLYLSVDPADHRSFANGTNGGSTRMLNERGGISSINSSNGGAGSWMPRSKSYGGVDGLSQPAKAKDVLRGPLSRAAGGASAQEFGGSSYQQFQHHGVMAAEVNGVEAAVDGGSDNEGSMRRRSSAASQQEMPPLDPS